MFLLWRKWLWLKGYERYGPGQAATITACKWRGCGTGCVRGVSSKPSPTHLAMTRGFWKRAAFSSLTPCYVFYSWHSVLPGQDGIEVLVKFIEADQQQSGFSHRTVVQTLPSALASRSVLRCKFPKQVSALFIRLHSCHTAWIKLLRVTDTPQRRHWKLKRPTQAPDVQMLQ